MQHIETVTLGSGGAASITFSAIPAGYTDLKIVLSGRSEGAVYVRTFSIDPNELTTNLSRRSLYYDSGSVGSDSGANGIVGYIPGSVATANTFGSAEIYIPNYRSSAAKSMSCDVVSENNSTSTGGMLQAILWNSTDPITSIRLTANSGDFAEHTTASLYGITAGSDGIVAVS